MAEPGAAPFAVLDAAGRADPRREPLPSLTTRLRMYREMRRVRLLDERLCALQRRGAIGFHGPTLGQEAVPVGAALALAPEDWVFPALREAAVMLVRGFPLVTFLAQTFGSARDVLKGRQMPSHQAGRSVHQVSWSSCIATQLPQAVGMAFAARSRGDKAIAVAFLGDGATSHPDFHAALNFAGVLRVPAVFVCQNNHYALSVPVARQTRSDSFAVKARAYGLPGLCVDGNDVLAVHAAVVEAAERARSGGGATFLECVTYRRGAHSTSDDPSRYRSPREEERWAELDPLLRLERHLGELGVLDAELAGKLDAAILAELDAALALVALDPAPPLESLFDDVYARRPFHLEEQLALATSTSRAATPA